MEAINNWPFFGQSAFIVVSILVFSWVYVNFLGLCSFLLERRKLSKDLLTVAEQITQFIAAHGVNCKVVAAQAHFQSATDLYNKNYRRMPLVRSFAGVFDYERRSPIDAEIRDSKYALGEAKRRAESISEKDKTFRDITRSRAAQLCQLDEALGFLALEQPMAANLGNARAALDEAHKAYAKNLGTAPNFDTDEYSSVHDLTRDVDRFIAEARRHAELEPTRIAQEE